MKTAAHKLSESPVRQRVSAEEWEVRVDLAACYRLAVHYRMTDLIYTHISARVPGPGHHFLINAFGFDYMYYLERACQTQIGAMSGGAKLRIPAPSVAEKTAAQFRNLPYKPKRPEWKALLRMLDKTDPSYKN